MYDKNRPAPIPTRMCSSRDRSQIEITLEDYNLLFVGGFYLRQPLPAPTTPHFFERSSGKPKVKIRVKPPLVFWWKLQVQLWALGPLTLNHILTFLPRYFAIRPPNYNYEINKAHTQPALLHHYLHASITASVLNYGTHHFHHHLLLLLSTPSQNVVV